MDKEIGIEAQGPVQDISEETAQLPINYLSVGTIETDDVKVYIHQSVISALEDYARSDTKNELGSILLGAYSNALGQASVMISEYIEAKYTDASASTLTFTHETWEYVHKQQAEKWPELRIVGWQHTHPGYGIFLSNYDMFIQENFFNLPFQIAYVIDPVQNTRGFFCWKNGRIERLKGYYIYDEPGKIIVPPTDGTGEPAVSMSSTNRNPLPQKKGFLGLTIALVVVCAALISAVALLWLRLSESDAQIQELFSRQHTIQEQMQSNSFTQNAVNADVAEKIGSIEADVADVRTQISDTQSQITEMEKTDVDSAVTFSWYAVQDGDTLQSICDSQNLSYEKTAKVILGINGLLDENEIVPGLMILLPAE